MLGTVSIRVRFHPCWTVQILLFFRYEWFKDGVPLDLLSFQNRIEATGDDGSFILHKMLSSDEGTYQCRASNTFGIAADQPVHLKKACMCL